MKYLPFLVFAVIIVGLFLFMSRTRRRATEGQLAQAQRIEVGTEVMTTSGLYGTVVTKSDDGTVGLSIAPGIEVRWELAALRDASSLPPNVGGGLRAADSPYDPPADGSAERQDRPQDRP